MTGWAWCGAAAVAVLALALFRRPLGAVCRLAVRSGVGLVLLWLAQDLGGLLGIHLGVNLLNALVLGTLGLPGFGLLLLSRWAALL